MKKIQKLLGVLVVALVLILLPGASARAAGENGIVPGTDGAWYYYVDGEIDYSYTGLVYHSDDNWYFVVNGAVDFNYSGLAFVNDNWWYVVQGKIDFNYCGLAYVNEAWWYVQGGKIDFGYTGLTFYNDIWWYVENGCVNFGYNGLAFVNEQWWYVVGGMIDFNYSGLIFFNEEWWFVTQGVIDFSYSGLIFFNDTWWYIENGRINFQYTGLAFVNENWWYVQGGVIDFGYNGLAFYSEKWWYVSGARIDFSYMGSAFYDDKWWYVENGEVNFNFTGFSTNDAGTWYFQNGMLDLTFSGVVTVDGVKYRILNGLVIGEIVEVPTTYTCGEWLAELEEKAGYVPAEDFVYESEALLTREFVAYTAVYALGFIPDTDLACSDAAEVTYLKEARIAVSTGMFALKENAFCPDEVVTNLEEELIRELIEEALNEREIDENYENKLIFADAVVEELINETDYEAVSENGDTYISLKQTAATLDIEAGEILVLPGNEQFADGLILVVTQVITEEGVVKVTGDVPEDLLDVYEYVDIQGKSAVDEDSVVPAEGVSMTVREPLNLLWEGSVDLFKDTKFFDFELLQVEGLEGSVTLQMPKLDYRLEYDRNGVRDLYLAVPNSMVLDVEVSGEYGGEVELASLSYYLIPGTLSVNLDLVLVYGLDGKASLEFRVDSIVGVQYVGGELLSIWETAMTQNIELEASAKAGLELELALYCFEDAKKVWEEIKNFFGDDEEDEKARPLYNVGAEIGLQMDAQMQAHVTEVLTMYCVDAKMYLYLGIGVGEESLIGETFDLKKSWDILTEDNSPFKPEIHLEKREDAPWTAVEECTYVEPVFLLNCAVTLSQDNYIYNGLAKEPTVTVTYEDRVIPASEYVVTYTDNVEIGTATVTVTPVDGTVLLLPGSKSIAFVIRDGIYDMADCTVTLSQDIFVFDGTAKEPAVTIINGLVEVPSAEYRVTYSNNTMPGTATVTIAAKDASDKLRGRTELTFTILDERTNLSECTIELSQDFYLYDGAAKEPAVSIKIDTLESTVEADDYTVEYSNNVNPGTATVTITALSESLYIVGSASVTFKIAQEPTDLADCTVTLLGEEFKYDGQAHEPEVLVVDDYVVKASEYTVTYSNNVEPGTATVTIAAKEGSNRISGSIALTFIIKKVQDMSVEIGDTELTEYESTAITASAWGEITYESSAPSVVTVDSEGKVRALTPGTAVITVRAAGGEDYDERTVEITVTVTSDRLYEGVDGGINWWITSEGFLVIRGTCGEEQAEGWENAGWHTYKNQVRSAYINVENATNLSCLFKNCTYLTKVDWAGVNTENVKYAEYLFGGCTYLRSLDLSSFLVETGIGMNAMFSGCSNLTELKLGTVSATYVSDMFMGCTSLKDLEFDKISGYSMSSMFAYCSSLTNPDVLKNLDTSDTVVMSNMFCGCSGLVSVDLSGFDTGKVQYMESMFKDCTALESVNLSGVDTSKVIRMREMFMSCCALKSLDLSGFDTANVWDMAYMFKFCNNLESLDVSSFNTAKLIYMDEMFSGCSNLQSLEVGGFDTANVTGMSGVFADCNSLQSLDVSGFVTGKVTTMKEMFKGCTALLALDVSKFDTGNVDDMSSMFYGCSSVSALDVSGFATGKVKYMENMFRDCSSLTSLNVSSFDTSKVTGMSSRYEDGTGMSYMFAGCSGLTSLDLSSFDTSNVKNMKGMFKGCRGLTEILVGENWIVPTDYTAKMSMFDSCGVSEVTIKE